MVKSIKETIISPIFYMGNKKKLINKGLTDYFPDSIRVFVDVFAGSSVVGMNVKADKHIVNDSDSNLVKLYELFKTNSADKIISHINSRIDEYGLARERKELDMSIKEKEQKLRNKFYACGFDYDDIRDDKYRLATCVDMRVFAEKTMRKYQHIKNERSSVNE